MVWLYRNGFLTRPCGEVEVILRVILQLESRVVKFVDSDGRVDGSMRVYRWADILNCCRFILAVEDLHTTHIKEQLTLNFNLLPSQRRRRDEHSRREEDSLKSDGFKNPTHLRPKQLLEQFYLKLNTYVVHADCNDYYLLLPAV